MQIDRRFADYALTGGFFLICQLGLIWWVGYWPTINPNAFEKLVPLDKSLVGPILTGFAGALAVNRRVRDRLDPRSAGVAFSLRRDADIRASPRPQ